MRQGALFDDRPKVSPAVKLTFAEPLGIPCVAIVGRAFVTGQVIDLDQAKGEQA